MTDGQSPHQAPDEPCPGPLHAAPAGEAAERGTGRGSDRGTDGGADRGMAGAVAAGLPGVPAFQPPEAVIRAVEDLWFWFMRHRCPDGTTAGRPRTADTAGDGAPAGDGSPAGNGPCHPLDVFRVVDGLYRHRRLDRDHLAVLGHYGRRQSAPDPRRRREQRAHAIWHEAIARLAPALRRRGLIP